MQKLSQKSSSNTPTDTSHIRSNCGTVLNNAESRRSVLCLKTCDNNSDATLTPTSGGLKAEKLVYVINKNGNPLTPCKPAKVNKLLDSGKATVESKTPFTIRLLWDCEESVPPITLGVDSGYVHIGLSAISNKQELYAADLQLRTDIVKLNAERRTYRRTRRNRKTWYRQPRFLNRKKPKGWLAPSIQHKVDSHIKIIDQISSILPISQVIVEVAAFDIQKIKAVLNGDIISGSDYQNGEQTSFWNVREYILYRDFHTCQHCKGKSKDPILEVHHIESRQTGSDRPGNLITLCDTCHTKVSQGTINPKFKSSKKFRTETFMSMVRWKIINQLGAKGYNVTHTYGYITKSRRIKLGLPKSHINDAFAIAGGTKQTRTTSYTIKQVRNSNRKLRKGSHSHIPNTAPRFIKGFQRFDKVLYNNIECFIFGRRITGYFDLRLITGESIHKSAKHSDLRLLEKAKTFLIEKTAFPLGFKQAQYPRKRIFS